MSIRDVIVMINQMEADGVIDRYAIGGAVGATFYLEPVASLDVDIFVALVPVGESRLLTLDPIYRYLTARGGIIEGEHIVIGGFPVQFLSAPTSLVEEGLANAIERDIEGQEADRDTIRSRVFAPEYLAAICLETGRGKDKARLQQFVEEEALDRARFESIVSTHGLDAKWKAFRVNFLGESQ